MSRRALIAAACVALFAALLIPNPLHRSPLPTPCPIHDVPGAPKVVALTYDDGPHPVYTPKLLAILRRYHVRATFFTIGSRMRQWPEIVREAARDGHVIANHTYTHPNNLDDLPRSRIVRELASEQSLIQRLAGRTYPIFRPPKGLQNPRLGWITETEGYTVVLWSVSAYHHDTTHTPEEMAERVLDLARPGSIILLHDGRFPMRWRDVHATPLIIEGLRKRGYRFVTVPELLRLSHSE